MWMPALMKKIIAVVQAGLSGRGQVVIAFGKKFQLLSSVVLGELVALREGLQTAKDMKLAHLEVFSDSLLARKQSQSQKMI